MRPIPILTALLVTAFLFLVVLKRDTLMEFAGVSPAVASDAAQAKTDAAPESRAPTAASGSRAVGVIAVHSTAQEIGSAVILRGQTEAAREVELRAQTSGTVTSEPLPKGTVVGEGQLLCELDPGTREAALSEAEAAVASAQIEMTQAEKLSKDGYASQTRLSSARAAMQSAQARLAAAAKDIERLQIEAPFAGLLEANTAELGTLLQAGGLCATVIQLDPIKLVGFVPETEVNRVKLGAMAGARLTDGREVTGTVSFLSRSADPQTRTFRTEIEVPNADMSIRDGQTTEILIAAAGTMAHLVPQSALTLADSGALGVRIVTEENTAKFVPTQLLRDTAEGVWLSGLPDQADVIIIGQEYVTDGITVRASFDPVNAGNAAELQQ